MNGDIDFAIGVIESFKRYQRCDWGDLCESDKAENELALKDGERIFALYNIGSDKIYIITEWDRSEMSINVQLKNTQNFQSLLNPSLSSRQCK